MIPNNLQFAAIKKNNNYTFISSRPIINFNLYSVILAPYVKFLPNIN